MRHDPKYKHSVNRSSWKTHSKNLRVNKDSTYKSENKPMKILACMYFGRSVCHRTVLASPRLFRAGEIPVFVLFFLVFVGWLQNVDEQNDPSTTGFYQPPARCRRRIYMPRAATSVRASGSWCCFGRNGESKQVYVKRGEEGATTMRSALGAVASNLCRKIRAKVVLTFVKGLEHDVHYEIWRYPHNYFRLGR